MSNQNDDFNAQILAQLKAELGSDLIYARSLSEFKEAREAEDLHGIVRDLQFVVDAIELLNETLVSSEKADSSEGKYSEDSTAAVIERSLYTAALIAYARCFGKVKRKPSGKRLLLDSREIFVGEHEKMNKIHKHFIDTRDKHLAHSVNQFEINRAGLFVVGSSQAHEENVGILSFHQQSETSGNVLALAELAEVAKEYAFQRSDELLTNIEKQAGRFTPAQKYALPPYMVEFRSSPSDLR